MNYKKEDGFTITDGIIAVIIITLFSGLIISLSYNLYLQANFIKRNDTATNYIVDLFEYAKGIENFEDITYSTLSTYNFTPQTRSNSYKQSKCRS